MLPTNISKKQKTQVFFAFETVSNHNNKNKKPKNVGFLLFFAYMLSTNISKKTKTTAVFFVFWLLKPYQTITIKTKTQKTHDFFLRS
jgi:hypothetical protein